MAEKENIDMEWERIKKLSEDALEKMSIFDMLTGDVEATKYLAEKGNSEAQYRLGWMYSRGQGVEQSNAKAFEWYKKAADAGDADALNNLGSMYAKGVYVEKDRSKAVDLFKKAVRAGNDTVARCNLAKYYLNENPYQKMDMKEGIRLLRKAAEKGYKEAIEYAFQYTITRDIPELKFTVHEKFEWYKKAAKHDETARKEYHQLLRDGIGDWDERVKEVGLPPYDKDAEMPLSQLMSKIPGFSMEKTVNIAYSCYQNMQAKPDVETFEKLMLADKACRYADTSKLVKDVYFKAMQSGRYITLLTGNPMEKVEAVLAKPNPQPPATRNKWFVIAAVLLLPAILPAIRVPLIRMKNLAGLALGFLLPAVISIVLIKLFRKPYGPLVVALQEKQATVDSFIRKYGNYINSMYLRSQHYAAGYESNDSYGYKDIIAYYRKLKKQLEKYERMDFGVKNKPAAKPIKKRDPRSRI